MVGWKATGMAEGWIVISMLSGSVLGRRFVIAKEGLLVTPKKGLDGQSAFVLTRIVTQVCGERARYAVGQRTE